MALSIWAWETKKTWKRLEYKFHKTALTQTVNKTPLLAHAEKRSFDAGPELMKRVLGSGSQAGVEGRSTPHVIDPRGRKEMDTQTM
jgi:hypothetical protein